MVDRYAPNSVVPGPYTSSTRVGSVWKGQQEMAAGLGSGGKRGTHDHVNESTPLRQSSDPNMRRREAASFIKENTGTDIPYSNDHDFRGYLRDGGLLWQTLLRASPDLQKTTQDKIHQAPHGTELADEEADHNRAVIINLLQQLRVPDNTLFSAEDLASTGWEERPRVVETILFIKGLFYNTGNTPLPSRAGSFMGLRGSNDTLPSRDNLSKPVRQSLDSVPSFNQALSKHLQCNSPLAASTIGQSLAHVNTTATTSTNRTHFSANDGISQLLQACSLGMASRMYHNGAQGAGMLVSTSNAGGVPASQHPELASLMENVIKQLTTEYENRLLVKDRELNDARETCNRLSKDLHDFRANVTLMQEEMAQQRIQLEACAAEETRARVAELEQKLQRAQTQLASKAMECDDFARRAEGRSSELDDEIVSLRAALEAHTAELDAFQGIEERYSSMLVENKKLYNQVQDLRGAIRVFCRVRPSGTTGDDAEACVKVGPDGCELAVYNPRNDERKAFRFDRVFEQGCSQQDVYADTQPLVRSVLDGYNVCIFAYGQTGSGKTHTMTGMRHQPDGLGINYRALDDLFALRNERRTEIKYTIKAQMLEIYNDNVRDLLAFNQGKDNVLSINATLRSGFNVTGAVQMEVHDTQGVLEMMDRGAKNRHSAETKMNRHSSRSHQVLTIIVDSENIISKAATHACLHLVDLAGSERILKSGAVGERLVEAQHINKSLTALGTVMASLASRAKHIPYRDAALTTLLADSLGGDAKVMMFIHVSPEGSSHSESMGTLAFGARVSEITLGQAKPNAESGRVFEAEENARKASHALSQAQEEMLHLKHRVAELEKALKLQTQTAQRNAQAAAALQACPSVSSMHSSTESFHDHLRLQQAAQAAGTGNAGLGAPLLRQNSLQAAPSQAPRMRTPESHPPPVSARGLGPDRNRLPGGAFMAARPSSRQSGQWGTPGVAPSPSAMPTPRATPTPRGTPPLASFSGVPKATPTPRGRTVVPRLNLTPPPAEPVAAAATCTAQQAAVPVEAHSELTGQKTVAQTPRGLQAANLHIERATAALALRMKGTTTGAGGGSYPPSAATAGAAAAGGLKAKVVVPKFPATLVPKATGAKPAASSQIPMSARQEKTYTGTIMAPTTGNKDAGVSQYGTSRSPCTYGASKIGSGAIGAGNVRASVVGALAKAIPTQPR